MSPKEAPSPIPLQPKFRRLRQSKTAKNMGKKTQGFESFTEEKEQPLCNILFYPEILQNTTEIDLLTYLEHCDLL